MKKKHSIGPEDPLAIQKAAKAISGLCENPAHLMEYCIEALGLISSYEQDHNLTAGTPFSNLSFIMDKIVTPYIMSDFDLMCNGIAEFCDDSVYAENFLDSYFLLIDVFLDGAHENKTVKEVTGTVSKLFRICYNELYRYENSLSPEKQPS